MRAFMEKKMKKKKKTKINRDYTVQKLSEVHTIISLNIHICPY